MNSIYLTIRCYKTNTDDNDLHLNIQKSSVSASFETDSLPEHDELLFK